MSDTPAPVQQFSLRDVLLLLGQKEVELQYEKVRTAQAQQVIEDLQAELAKYREGH